LAIHCASFRFFLFFYSILLLARKRERVAVPNNKTITICVYWSLNKKKEKKREKRERTIQAVCNNEGLHQPYSQMVHKKKKNRDESKEKYC
jgi:hypothetical protein